MLTPEQAMERLRADLDQATARLDVNDLRIESLETGLSELRNSLHTIQSGVFRLFDAVTAHALTSERQSRTLASQGQSLGTMAANIASVLSLLQPKVEL